MTMLPEQRPWFLWDLVLATVVATIAVQYRVDSVQDALIGLAMAAALIARRRAPVPVMVAVSVLALLQVFVGRVVPAGYDLAVLVAMVAVVTHARTYPPAYLSGAAVAVGVAIAAVHPVDWNSELGAIDQVDVGSYSTLFVACGALWLLAFTLRTNREKAAAFAERAATAERERDQLARLAAADERAAIARELHDVVAHSLAVMIAQADGASYAIGRGNEQAREAMRTVAGTGRDALADMHRIVAVLRGSESDVETDRRRVGLDEVETLVERARSAGLDVQLRIDGDPVGLSAADELTIFRLAQEGLTNALRHAGPGAHVVVAMRFAAGEAVIEVTDDGGGRTALTGPGEPRGSGGNGLIGMRERVAVHGGEFTAGPGPVSGWQVRAVIPIKVAA